VDLVVVKLIVKVLVLVKIIQDQLNKVIPVDHHTQLVLVLAVVLVLLVVMVVLCQVVMVVLDCQIVFRELQSSMLVAAVVDLELLIPMVVLVVQV
jgi:hypothetical protein